MAEKPLPPLDRVDPAQAWQPWKPDKKQPWNLKWAGHLYRRAAFGAHLEDLRKAVKSGLPATLERLFMGDPNGEEQMRSFHGYGKAAADPSKNSAYQLRGWWLWCMFYSSHPLREKMTLFWHNHFATSIGKVKYTMLMFFQNKLLREHAMGKFEPFLQAMSKDPAMLIWLDSNSNITGKPNENYARELMELFSLGVGNYSEKDVQEAARAFTGWHTTSDNSGADFQFNARLHDEGAKTVLGKTGNLNGDDVVRICLQQPVAARFLVRKLYRFFISETQAPPDALIEPLADQYRKSDYDTASLVQTMLRSRHFFSGYAYRQRIKSPVEFVLGAANDVLYLIAPLDEKLRSDAKESFVQPKAMVGKLDNLGQQLFAPPNVKGWEGGRAWLNTAVVLARHNFAQSLTLGSGRINVPDSPEDPTRLGPAPDPSAIFRRLKISEPDKLVALLVDALFQGDLNAPARAKLVAFLEEGKPAGNALDQRIREVIHALMTIPEYQLA